MIGWNRLRKQEMYVPVSCACVCVFAANSSQSFSAHCLCDCACMSMSVSVPNQNALAENCWCPLFNHSYDRKKSRPFEFGQSWKFIACSYLRLLFSPILSYHMFVFEVFSIAIILTTAMKSINKRSCENKSLTGCILARSIRICIWEIHWNDKFAERVRL